jgi:hypothetical protein
MPLVPTELLRVVYVVVVLVVVARGCEMTTLAAEGAHAMTKHLLPVLTARLLM